MQAKLKTVKTKMSSLRESYGGVGSSTIDDASFLGFFFLEVSEIQSRSPFCTW